MPKSSAELTAAGLFSGIGGFELGFLGAGIPTVLACEKDPAASAVLRLRLAETPLHNDVTTLSSLPSVNIIAAGFPCQNLSLVGMNAGITGAQSSLVNEVFRLISHRSRTLKWVVLENVPFMLHHRGGEAIRYVTQALKSLGFRWAYRVIDARAFGLPQTRRRVIIVASRTENPTTVLFADNAVVRAFEDDGKVPCGFSWTEGRLGLGWAVNSVPTLKAGSAVGVISPPAIWARSQRRIVTPEIRDAERLQGFRPGWTDVTTCGTPVKLGFRWRMVGNAIPVPFARWVGARLARPGAASEFEKSEWTGGVWPKAAYSDGEKIYRAHVTEWPVHKKLQGLDEFLKYDTNPLSIRAASGFLKRARSSKLRFADGFLDAVEDYISREMRYKKSEL